MDMRGIEALRDAIRLHDPLRAWSLDRFGKLPWHVQGLRKPASADEYPAVGYGILREQIVGARRIQEIGVAWFVHQSEIHKSGELLTYQGEIDLAEMGELINGVFEVRRVGEVVRVGAEIDTLSDLIRAHPFYWGEMRVPIEILD